MTILRIQTPGAANDDPVKVYLERLVKLIPAEVVALYLAGKALILQGADAPVPGTDRAFWVTWSVFCLATVIVARAWATSNKQQGIKPQWPAVAIAAISFVVWLFSFGDVFVVLGVDWQTRTAGLVVLAWTFIVPFLYRGDTDAGGGALAAVQTGPTGRAWKPPTHARMALEEIAVAASATLRIAAEPNDKVKRFVVSIDDRPVTWTDEENGTVVVAGACGDAGRHRLNYTVAGTVGAKLTLTVFCGPTEVLKLEDIEVFPAGEPLAVGWGRFTK